MYRLVFREGPYKGKRLTVQQGTVVIGRDPDCHIHLSEEAVSWKHAVIEERGDGLYIRDMGSLNKIVVNGEEVREAKLNHGDELTFGESKIQYQQVQPITVEGQRRISHVQGITFASVGLVLLLELIFLAALSAWRVDRNGGLGPPPPQVVAVVAGDQEKNEAASCEHPTEELALTAEITPAKDEPGQEKAAEAEAAKPEPAQEEPARPPEVEAEQSVEIQAEITEETREETIPEKEVAKSADQQFREDAVEQETTTDQEEKPAAEPEFIEKDPLLELAREMLADARLEIQKHNLVQADQHLARLQIVAPDFFPAYAERARLFESRGRLKEAGSQWAQLIRRSMGTAWYKYAIVERSRVAREEGISSRTEKPAGARTQARTRRFRLPQQVEIHSVERQKLAATDEFNEMRLVTTELRLRMGSKYIQGEKVELKVSFFDRDEETGAIFPTRVFVPEAAVRFTGKWKRGDSRKVGSAYIVPQGFRAKEKKELGSARAYYGYTICVYYDGKLQDQEAQPKDLLELISEKDKETDAVVPDAPVEL